MIFNPTLSNLEIISPINPRCTASGFSKTSVFSNMQKEISTLRELKALQESTTFTLETINQALLKRVEVLGIRPQIENELNMIIDLIDNLKDKLPHTIIQNIESEKPQPKPTIPGKVIGQAPGA